MTRLRDEKGELANFDDIAEQWAKEAIIDALEDDISWTCDGSPASIADYTKPDMADQKEWRLIIESAIEALELSGTIKRLPYNDEDFYVLACQYDASVKAIDDGAFDENPDAKS